MGLPLLVAALIVPWLMGRRGGRRETGAPAEMIVAPWLEVRVAADPEHDADLVDRALASEAKKVEREGLVVAAWVPIDEEFSGRFGLTDEIVRRGNDVLVLVS